MLKASIVLQYATVYYSILQTTNAVLKASILLQYTADDKCCVEGQYSTAVYYCKLHIVYYRWQMQCWRPVYYYSILQYTTVYCIYCRQQMLNWRPVLHATNGGRECILKKTWQLRVEHCTGGMHYENYCTALCSGVKVYNLTHLVGGTALVMWYTHKNSLSTN